MPWLRTLGLTLHSDHDEIMTHWKIINDSLFKLNHRDTPFLLPSFAGMQKPTVSSTSWPILDIFDSQGRTDGILQVTRRYFATLTVAVIDYNVVIIRNQQPFFGYRQYGFLL
jgi:hypothetical protein